MRGAGYINLLAGIIKQPSPGRPHSHHCETTLVCASPKARREKKSRPFSELGSLRMVSHLRTGSTRRPLMVPERRGDFLEDRFLSLATIFLLLMIVFILTRE